MLHDVPVGIDMQKNRLYGIVGGANKMGAVDVVYNIAAQIAANNCYTDVKMVLAYNGKTLMTRKNGTFSGGSHISILRIKAQIYRF